MSGEPGFFGRMRDRSHERALARKTEAFLDEFPYAELRALIREELVRSDAQVSKADWVSRDHYTVGPLQAMRKSGAAADYDVGMSRISPEARPDDMRIANVVHETLHMVSDHAHHEGIAHDGRDAMRTSLMIGPLIVSVPLLFVNPVASAAAMGVTASAVGGVTAWNMIRNHLRAKRGEDTTHGFRGGFGGELIDEGMTKLIEAELTPELMRRTGNSHLIAQYEARQGNFFDTEPRPGLGTYPMGQLLMVVLMSTIAQKSGVPVRDVYQGFKKQYFTAGINPEIRTLFEEMLGSEVVSRLAALDADSPPKAVYDIIRDYLDKRIIVDDRSWRVNMAYPEGEEDEGKQGESSRS